MASNLDRSKSDDESVDSTGKQKSFRRLCVRFAEKTSMQGVPYINSARLIYSKVIWTIMFVIAIGVMIAHLVYLCDQFFAWPKITKLELQFSKLELPELTICNNNIIKKSQLHLASPRLQNYVRNLDPAVIIKQTAPNIRKKRFVSELKQFNFSAYDDYDYENTYDNTDGLGPPSEMFELETTFRSLYMEEPRHIRVAMGHNISDMLLSCAFNGRQCYADNFTLYTTADYGNCFTLPSRKYVTTQSGPTRGLQLIFYMENEEYLDGVNQGYGARISLRDSGQIPFPADDGFFVPSYSETDIGLKLVAITRKGQPYGTCEDGTAFQTRYKRKYSRQACQKMWEQTYIIRRCGCFNEEYAEIYRVATLDVRPCRARDEQKCLALRQAELNNRTSVPDCDNPCSENVYVRQLSSRQWPTEAYSNFLLQSVCESYPQRCTNMRAYDKRQLSLNFLKILIYYEDLNYESITEEAEIENAQFASDVGGAVGLWIGLSMLSVFEVVQLCLECCDYGRHKCKKAGEREDRRKEKKKKDVRKQNYEVNSMEFGSRKDNFGLQRNSSDYDHLKRNDGFRENMYNPSFRMGTPQPNNDYQSVDDYYIYKGPQRI